MDISQNAATNAVIDISSSPEKKANPHDVKFNANDGENNSPDNSFDREIERANNLFDKELGRETPSLRNSFPESISSLYCLDLRWSFPYH